MPTTPHFSITILNPDDNYSPFDEFTTSSDLTWAPTSSTDPLPEQVMTTFIQSVEKCRFAVRIANVGYRINSNAHAMPSSIMQQSHSETIDHYHPHPDYLNEQQGIKEPKISALLYLNNTMVYGKLLSTPGVFKVVEGWRIAEGSMKPFIFGESGQIKLEIWLSVVTEEVKGKIPTWSNSKGNNNDDRMTSNSTHKKSGSRSNINNKLNNNLNNTSHNGNKKNNNSKGRNQATSSINSSSSSSSSSSIAVPMKSNRITFLTRKIGKQPIATFIINYGQQGKK